MKQMEVLAAEVFELNETTQPKYIYVVLLLLNPIGRKKNTYTVTSCRERLERKGEREKWRL